MDIWLRIIAVLEITGGLVGIPLMIWVISVSPFHPLSLLLAPIPVAIYAFSLVAGVALWRRQKFGRTASIIVQCIQIPKIISPAFIFMFSFGFDLWVHFLRTPELYNYGFEMRLGAFNQLFFNMPTAPFGLGVSIPGCVFLIILVNRKMKDLLPIAEPPLPPKFDPSEPEM